MSTRTKTKKNETTPTTECADCKRLGVVEETADAVAIAAYDAHVAAYRTHRTHRRTHGGDA